MGAAAAAARAGSNSGIGASSSARSNARTVTAAIHRVRLRSEPASQHPLCRPPPPPSPPSDKRPTDLDVLRSDAQSRSDIRLVGEMPVYYDIDDILMEEEVEKGAKVDLPFWLAHGLLSLEQAVSISPHPCFTEKTRKEIQADAACVDLRVRCPYFYELGCKIVPLIQMG